MSAISPFVKQRQKDLQFKTSLDYIVSQRPQWFKGDPYFKTHTNKISDKTHDSVYSLLGKRLFFS